MDKTTERTTVDEWREINGLTLKDMADAMDMDLSIVSRYVSGKREFSDGFYYRFIRAYGIRLFNHLFPDEAIK